MFDARCNGKRQSIDHRCKMPVSGKVFDEKRTIIILWHLVAAVAAMPGNMKTRMPGIFAAVMICAAAISIRDDFPRIVNGKAIVGAEA